MLGDRAPGAAPGLPRRRKAAHAGPSLLGLARVRTRGASTAQLWLAPPLTAKHTELTAAPPPAPGPGTRTARHLDRLPPPTVRPQFLKHLSEQRVGPAPCSSLDGGAPGPRHRGRGRDLQGWRGLQTDQALRPAPSGGPRASGKGRRGCFKAPGGKPENRAGRQGQGGRRRRGQRGNRRSSQDRRTRWGRRRGAGSGQRRPVASWAGPLGLGLRLEEGVQAGAWQVLRTLGSGL